MTVISGLRRIPDAIGVRRGKLEGPSWPGDALGDRGPGIETSAAAGGPSAPAGRGKPGRGGAVRVVALASLVAVCGIAWGVGILYRAYDYDEVLRAHHVWLVSRGLRPYQDFFEVHPPYFALLTPVMEGIADPYRGLLALRVVSLVGNLAFLAALVAIAVTSISSGRLWAMLGVALTASHQCILVFLSEFRIDGWAYALIAWGLYRFRRAGSPWRYAELGLVTGVASLLFCLKFAMLAPLVVLSRGVIERQGPRRFLRNAGWYGLGSGLAVAIFGIFLAAWRPGSVTSYADGLRVQSEYGAIYRSRFGFGLLKELAVWRTLAAMVIAGLIGWVMDQVVRRAPPRPYHLAMAVCLATMALVVPLPYKQYYAPWFLFATAFVAYLGPALDRLPGWIGTSAFVAACGVSASAVSAEATTWYRTDLAGYHRSMIGVLRQYSRPGDHVVAAAPFHPIDRADVFYLSMCFFDPQADADLFLDASPTLRGRVSPRGYREELEAHPPAFVVIAAEGWPRFYSARQIEVMGVFLRERSYRLRRIGLLRVAIRPDRDGVPSAARP
jgi:hypothetical protein